MTCLKSRTAGLSVHLPGSPLVIVTLDGAGGVDTQLLLYPLINTFAANTITAHNVET